MDLNKRYLALLVLFVLGSLYALLRLLPREPLPLPEDPQPQVVEAPAIEEKEALGPPPLSVVKGMLNSGETLYDALRRDGLDASSLHQLLELLKPHFDVRRAQPGVWWTIGISEQGPEIVTLNLSPLDILVFSHNEGTWVAEQRPVARETRETVHRVVLESSLFEAFQHLPQSSQLAQNLAAVFAWDIDFYMDPRKGDHITVLVEEIWITEGDPPRFHEYGRILAAKYTGQKENACAYGYLLEEGNRWRYFDDKGQSVIRNVLKSPLKLVRVTSKFRGQRFHPILKHKRPHNGVDYGAPLNTPVYAVADGTVTVAGWHGGAGKAVILSHAGNMVTQYFHLNYITKGLRKGSRVQQGQLLGGVGKTGLATGTHLHFGMKKNGVYVDPLKQKFQPGKPLPQELMTAFRTQVARWERLLTPVDGALDQAPGHSTFLSNHPNDFPQGAVTQ